MAEAISNLDQRVSDAVAYFWRTRLGQAARQQKNGGSDRGLRGAVTGGKQMDGFVKLLCDLAVSSGVADACVHCERAIELPGFFRPSKQWDLLIVSGGRLLAVVELKSQVGPSFGNNFNNRVEEAIGSAIDLWTAYREGAFPGSTRPWLGYLFMLEDCTRSTSPVKVEEPHFKAFPEFIGAS